MSNDYLLKIKKKLREKDLQKLIYIENKMAIVFTFF